MPNIAIRTLVILFLIAGYAFAQEAQPQAPDAAEAQPALQHARERYRLVSRADEVVTVLDNGLTIIARRLPSPVLTVRGYVRTGGMYEGKWLGGGLSHLLEHLVAGGSTEKRTEAQSRELLQMLGNNSNAYTTTDHTAYFINTTPENLAGAVDLLTDWLFHARITEEEYAREYEVVQRELEKGKGEPGRQFYYLAQMNRYRVSPARVPVIGFQEVIRGLTRDDVYAYYKLAYVPSNIVLVIVGDVDPEQVIAAVKPHVDLPPGRVFSHDVADEPPVLTPRTVAATFPGLGQAYLQIGFPTIRLDHPDLYALDTLATILADGESSILVQEIRDRRRLVSGIAASSYTPEYATGTFAIFMQLDPDNIQAATQAVLEQIERIKVEGVEPDRLERAKTQMRTDRIRGMQTSEQVASSLARDFLSTGDPHFSDVYVERIQQVTADQVQEMARRYLDTSRLLTTALLPAEHVGAAGLPAAEQLLRSAVPTVDEEAPAEQPQITRIQLDNNLILLHKRISTTPLVSARMFALGGLTRESAENNGIGNLTMDMLTRGTTNRSAADIAAFFDSIGGTISAGMGNNTWYWNASFLREDFEKAIEVYADVVNNPAFPEDELPALRARALAAIASLDADWTSQAFRYFRQQYYGPLGSPYQFQGIGRKEVVESLTADQLRQWYDQQIRPSRRVLAIFGDVSLEDARAAAERYFGQGDALPTDTPVTEAPPAQPIDSPHPAVEVVRVEVQQSRHPLAGVVIGFESGSVIGDAERHAIGVADTMSSGYGYPTGYLHEVLRGRGLVYVVHAVNSPGLSRELPGTFIAYAGCDPARVNEVVELMLQNIARLQGSEADLVPGWFDRAKQLMLVSQAMDRQTPAEQAMAAALDELYGLGFDDHLKAADRIRAVTLDDVRQVARRRLSRAVITISTPRPELVKLETGLRAWENLPPVDLTPRGIGHDGAGNGQ